MDHKRPRNEEIYRSTSDANKGNGIKRRKVDQDSPKLCEKCLLLDLDKGFNEAYEFYKSAREGKVHRRPELYSVPDGPLFYADAFLVHTFGDRLSKSSNCSLCLFFRSLRVQPEDHESHKLLAFCSSESSLFNLLLLKRSDAWDNITHTVFMAVVPDVPSISPNGHGEYWLERDIPTVGSIYRLRPDESDDESPCLLEPQLLGDSADFHALREWLSFCRAHHGSACKRQNTQPPVSRGFRVIDCMADPPTVISIPWGITYAALSYVWGQSPEDLVDWPKTVLDAVEVTRDLGLQYLWVDRLCINQSDPVEKSYLISRMTTIYEEADFTIVAAAGSGASHGLPGVRSTTRQPQPNYRLESGSLLISIGQDPRRGIPKSDYWTRGWTYQEGVLSNRRLVFTANQVYWECRCMAIHESIQVPLHLFHENYSINGDSGMRMADFMLGGIFKGDTYSGGSSGDEKELVIFDDADRMDYGFPNHRQGSIRAQLRGLNEHIRAFSARKLSHDTDSLAAFLGIVGLYKSTENIHLYLGIPIWMNDILGDLTGSYITFALSVCSWYHRGSSEHRMFVSEPCRRRNHLPSWTWAGWQGAVTWRAPPSDEHCVIMSDLIESENLHLVWAADIYLRSTCEPICIRLLNTYSVEQLEDKMLTLLEIRDPLVLKYTRRHETEGSWEWRRLAGRAGGDQYYAERLDWDKKWYRIAGRLASVNMSISVTEKEWTDKHESGEFVSVLVFASKFPTMGHGRARFLTLRRVESTSFETRWERIGTLQLTIPEGDLARCMTNEHFLDRIPVRGRRGAIVVQ